jgi:hypothetical protein
LAQIGTLIKKEKKEAAAAAFIADPIYSYKKHNLLLLIPHFPAPTQLFRMGFILINMMRHALHC